VLIHIHTDVQRSDTSENHERLTEQTALRKLAQPHFVLQNDARNRRAHGETINMISGVTLAVGYTVLGGGWLRLKSNLLLQEFARRSLRVSVPVFAVLFGIACLYSAQIQPGVRSQWTLHPIALPCLLALFAIGVGALTVLTERVRPTIPLVLGLFLFVVGISGMALIVFPNIVPFSVSLWDAASSSASQEFVLIGATIVTPVVLGYSAFAYWVFRGRTPEKGWEE
jgi:cytochrome bd ubiquinol oxidase subunit II